MADIGTQIFASDFKTLQDKAESLLGVGSGSRGYGQTVLSADVFSGNAITKAQWDALRYDIINIRFHQDGVVPGIVQINQGDVIRYGSPNPIVNFDTLLEQAIANRFNIAGSQSITSTEVSQSYTSPWSTQAQTTLTCTFADSNAARYFFNSGGKIRITPVLSGGSFTSQMNAWKNLLSSVGVRSFGANTAPTINYYTLTNSYQTYYENILSSPYSSNYYRLEVKCDVADNSNGTATQVQIRVTLRDDYVDPGAPAPGDSVDGTLTIYAGQVRASGPAQPSGNFSVAGPSFSLSSISAT